MATVGVDETASRCGQRYVTVLLDIQRKQGPVIFAVPGHSKDAIKAFSAFLAAHGGDPDNVLGGPRHVSGLSQRRCLEPHQRRGDGRLVLYRADLHQGAG
ncbi:transposase [Halomonas sp. V046]|uniref:transposase n=1 Tax=Halomonas sp. V046 TaxID=3459611 RepID=UPI0040439F48